eukprot:3484312-Pleurochrysis_carterae.AAC.1
MAFGGDSAVGLPWYAGIVGPAVEGADGHSCGFDDGEHRLVTFAEVRIGVESTGSIAPLPHDTGGLCNGLKQSTRALNFTFRMEGQQKEAYVIGVLLGDPFQVLLDGVPLYSAHHRGGLAKFGDSGGSGGVAAGTRRRRKTRTSNPSTPSSIEDVPDRRGYQTFRRGDVVDVVRGGETSDATADSYPDLVRAIVYVYGLVASKVKTKLGEYVVLYCKDGAGADDEKPYFFFSSWTAWQRAQKLTPDVLTSRFDSEEDDSVLVASSATVSAMEK